MSGHSHFKSIKHAKEITDAKKGKVFSKITRLITIAAREGGKDPISNSRLRIVIDQAKEFNMPKENIERALSKGTGELAGENLEEVIFEAFGPGGIALIIEGITDNKNRTNGEIKQILSQHNGKMAGEGAVRWLFERKGFIIADCKSQNENLKNKEDLELLTIEAGADDLKWDGDYIEIYSKSENLDQLKKNLGAKGLKIESSAVGWIAKDPVEVSEKDKESCLKLFEALDDNESVQEAYSNLKI